jgi:chromosomal replication initiator protein
MRGNLEPGEPRNGPLVEATDSVRRDDLEGALRAAIAQRLGESRFRLWFGDGVRLGLSGDGESLHVCVPNVFFREWIRDHFSTSLVEAAQAITGRSVQLAFSVLDEMEPGPGEVVGPETDSPERRRGGTIVVPFPGHPKSPLPAPGPQPLAPDRSLPRRPREASSLVSLPPGIELPSRPGSESSRGSGVFPLAPSLRPARGMNDFVTGLCNQLAHAAAQEMIATAGAAFNPLFVYGGVGLGKTHLLEAVVHGLRRAHPVLQVLWTTAEAFTNAFLEAMRSGTLGGFRSRYRAVGAMVVDDVHFLAGTRATQNEFLHTFNALVERGAPIVLSADQHPRRISRLTDELVTRFLGGMVVKLDLPDLATRRRILQTKSSARGVTLPMEVIDYMAEHLRSSIRELEGALHSVIAHALLTGKRLDLALARSALRDTVRHTALAVGLRDVERAVCQLFQIDADALKSESRARALAYPRMLAMYLARKHTGAAYAEIGRHFGGRNHSTVISAEKKVAGWLRAEEQSALLPGFETVADLVAELERILGT